MREREREKANKEKSVRKTKVAKRGAVFVVIVIS